MKNSGERGCLLYEYLVCDSGKFAHFGYLCVLPADSLEEAEEKYYDFLAVQYKSYIELVARQQ